MGGIPYNYPYYERLVRSAGFSKERDYLSGHVGGDYRLPSRFLELADKVRARRGFSAKRIRSKRELRACAHVVMRTNNQAFTHVWGYYPIDEAETEAIADRILSVADPRLIKLVAKGDGSATCRIVGFILAYHDLSAGLRRVPRKGPGEALAAGLASHPARVRRSAESAAH